MSETSDIAALAEWYKKPVGAVLLQSELVGLSSILPQIFGYYIIQIGGPISNDEVLATSHIHNHIIVNPDTATPNDSPAVRCQLDELPFLPDSIDAAVLFHVLEFAQNPKAILKEIYTTLMPNGYAIIFGFNPYSLWGMTPLWQKQKEVPWLGNWISPGHMRHLLAKIGFSIGDYKTFYFRPPNTSTGQLLFLEGLGQIFWPYCGASYMFVAQKTLATLTPIKPLFSFVKYFKTAKTLPKPARTSQYNKN
ncbi:Generic methyl-transferase [Gammaproteobacteria bacterium]